MIYILRHHLEPGAERECVERQCGLWLAVCFRSSATHVDEDKARWAESQERIIAAKSRAFLVAEEAHSEQAQPLPEPEPEPAPAPPLALPPLSSSSGMPLAPSPTRFK